MQTSNIDNLKSELMNLKNAGSYDFPAKARYAETALSQAITIIEDLDNRLKKAGL